MSSEYFRPVPIATWNPVRYVWERPQDALCGHSVPYLATFPQSGSMRTGALYPPLTPGVVISASESSSSPGLLKTPTAQLAVNGGSQAPEKRRAGGHGPTLADQVEYELLPSPAARDWKSGESNLIGTNARPLNEVVVNCLLPSPWATDGTHGGPNQRGSSGDLMLPSVAVRVASGDLVDWGKYSRAVLYWQQVTGRMVPHPLVLGKSKPVLSPVFVEWMMGLAEGWVTGVPDLSRNAKLKILGNGVVPQQAVLALRLLLERISDD